MLTSRTRPTKLATAPTLALLEIPPPSTPRSKSSCWTLTFIRCRSSTRYRWEECNLVAGLDRRRRLHHVLVDRCANWSIRREHIVPGAASSTQMLPQRAEAGNARREIELLARMAELFAQRGEKKQRHSHR